MRTLFLILAVVVISSCNPLEEGVVIDKWYEPEESGITTTIGSDGYPHIEHWYEPEHWGVEIEGYVDGEYLTNWTYVKESEYNAISLGDTIRIR